MKKLLLALAAACFVVALAMPVQAESRTKPTGLNTGDGAAETSDVSSQRRYYRGYYGPRRAWWGPRYYWRPRPAFWGPRFYWGGPAITFGFGPRWWW